MATVKAVIFDFGNVIAFFDHMLACNRLARRTGPLSPEDIYDRIFRTKLEPAFDCGEVGRDRFLAELRTMGVAGHDEEVIRDWADVFTPNERVMSVMPRISPEVKVILGSNTNECHYDFFRPKFAAALDRCDAEILSFRVGCVKPDRRFYEACLQAAGCEPGECLYFDDRPALIEAAGMLGIRGIVYHPEVDVAAELSARGIRLQG